MRIFSKEEMKIIYYILGKDINNKWLSEEELDFVKDFDFTDKSLPNIAKQVWDNRNNPKLLTTFVKIAKQENENEIAKTIDKLIERKEDKYMDNEIMIIKNVRGYQDENGVAKLNLEDIARGLGFTQIKGNVEYIRWERIKGYLKEFNFPTSGENGKMPEYIPENIFYKLCFKAENEIAKKFQDIVTDEVLPSIRKHGGYIAGQEQMTDEELMAKAVLMANSKIQELSHKNKQLQAVNSELIVTNEIMKPKAEYFDELVDRNLLTGFRETAKALKIKEKKFVNFLLEHKYVYRDKKGKLQPYADKNNGLFEMKETINEKTKWVGTQTLITPKGRETFRLLCVGI